MAEVLKIFFHDNCFDGASSAAVFADFYKQCINGAVELIFQGVQHKTGDPFADHVLDGDNNACLDFRYCPDPKMTWWFDHHISAFQPKDLQTHFAANKTEKQFYDPTEQSCTRFIAETVAERFGYKLPQAFEEVVHWAHLIDGAKFDSPESAVALADPALQLMTWLESNNDDKRTHQLIRDLGHRPLDMIAQEPWVQKPLQPILAEHARNLTVIKARAEYKNDIVFFDLLDDDVGAHNKFISYFLYPAAHYTVALSRSPERLKLSVGSNPWRPEARSHNIAAICERYGGGGHPVVGGISLPLNQRDRAREIATEIRAELSQVRDVTT